MSVGFRRLEAASDRVVFRLVFLREWSQRGWGQKAPGRVRWAVVLRVRHQGETYLLNQEAQAPLCDDGPFALTHSSIFWALQIMGRVLAFLERDSLQDLETAADRYSYFPE